MKTLLYIGAGAAVALALTAPAQAGGNCVGDCYRKVVRAPVYGTVAEQVLVRPAESYTRVIPALYGTVQERVLVRPPETVAEPVPPVYETVAERVMVAPASREWRVTRDRYGREVGCWVTVPPRYAVQHRQVLVRPGGYVHRQVPGVYALQRRQVVVSPERYVQETSPAVYGVQRRSVMLEPARADWVPLNGGY